MRVPIATALPFAVSQPAYFDLVAFQAGDAGTFRALFNNLSIELHRYLLYRGLSDEDARDIFASVAAKLYHRRTRMQSYTHIRRSIYTIARNEAIDCLQLHSKRRKAEIAIRYLHDRTETLTDRTLALRKDKQLQNIWQEIARLPPQRQKVLQLYYIQGLTTPEIAHRLNISPQTVLNHKSKAVAALKMAVSPSDPDW